MILINILHGSSCVGKSTLMKNSHHKYYKLEMDDVPYWEHDESLWGNICFNFLIQHIIKNKKISRDTGVDHNMLVTCGGLPLPNDTFYFKLETVYGVIFRHTLILTKSPEQYLEQIKKRRRTKLSDTLVGHYKWRESTKYLFHEIIINDGK